MPRSPSWQRCPFARAHRKEILVLLATAGILVLTRASQAPSTSLAQAPASLRQAILDRAELGGGLSPLVPPSPESRLGHQPKALPEGRLAFEARPCFFVTPQPTFASFGDLQVEYQGRLAFHAELEPWVSERAAVDVSDLARGTLQLRNVRRREGLAVPDPSGPCRFDADRAYDAVTGELVGDASFLGWRLRDRAPEAPRDTSGVDADISVAGEGLRIGVLLSEVRTLSRKKLLRLGPNPREAAYRLDELVGLPDFPGTITVEAFDGAKQRLTLRVDTSSNDQARPAGMRPEDLCDLGVSRALKPGETCRYVPGRGDTLVVVRWNDDKGSGARASARERVLYVAGYRTSLGPPRSVVSAPSL